jgi:transcriptional regulator with XRE-family HTH domain
MTSKPHHIDILVGTNLRRLRINAGMTMVQFAAEIGVSYQQLQKYEHARNRVSASMLWECAEALDVSVSSFFQQPPGSRNDTQL